MPCGMAVAGDAFQPRLNTIFNNLDSCTCIADGMIIWDEKADGGNNYLTKFLQAKGQCNLKLDLGKLQFKTKQPLFLQYHTHIIYDDHEPEDDKVQAINKMSQPTNVRELQCFGVWSTT